ncbi:hypothetical protein cypCar_00026128, partial [Cyprinus carpio]
MIAGEQLSLITSKDSILQTRQEKGVAYDRSFPGYMLIDWLLQNGEIESRREGLDLCKALLKHGIIQHVQPTLDGRCGSLTHLQQSSRGYPLTASLTVALAVRCNPTSVLKRHVTCEELFSPGAPYVKRVLTILGDALGWGFVVRGKSPCYVQAVDPASPAAAAGIKVRQFVCRVNGH